jgi:hypothetical protein
MPGFISDSPLARELIRVGDEAIATEDDAKLNAYFRDDYVFHGPGGDLSFAELSAYFASLRVGFSNLRIVREQIIVDGNFLAARTAFSGDFTSVFTYSPIDPWNPPVSTSSGKSSAYSGTTTVGAWPRSGCRPTTAAS